MPDSCLINLKNKLFRNYIIVYTVYSCHVLGTYILYQILRVLLFTDSHDCNTNNQRII